MGKNSIMKPISALAFAAVMGLSACAGSNMTSDQQYATGALVGGAAGLAAADAAGGSSTDKAAATLVGAAAGGAIAGNAAQRNRGSRCVYPDGRPAPCP